MDNRIKLLAEIWSSGIHRDEVDYGDMYIAGHKAVSDDRNASVYATEQIFDESA